MDSELQARFPITQPENWVRAILSDQLYQRMINNPDERVPFLVNWQKLAQAGLV